MPGQWRGSTRRSQLPGDWAARRRAVLARDGHRCTWVQPGTDGARRCGRAARDVDHRDRLGGHELTNLRALCSWHHSRKTSSEGNNARVRITTKRAVELHPGFINEQT
jgi:hypothetical protein